MVDITSCNFHGSHYLEVFFGRDVHVYMHMYMYMYIQTV